MSASPSHPLIVLLHGVGNVPADMAPLADAIAAALPGARIEAPAGLEAYDLGPHGRQWFSVAGITEDNRPARTFAALPAFVAMIRALQRRHETGPEDTILIGYSQGASMALVACQDHWLARHVVGIAGRCVPLPARWEMRTAVDLVHGRMDAVVPADWSRRTAAALAALGAAVRLDLVPRIVHQLAPALVERAVAALRAPPDA